MVYLLKIVIFYSYAKLPEGTTCRTTSEFVAQKNNAPSISDTNATITSGIIAQIDRIPFNKNTFIYSFTVYAGMIFLHQCG